MKTMEDIRKRLQEMNEHIKKEQKKSQIPIPYCQHDVLKWVLEE
jgi:hypothetical protein